MAALTTGLFLGLLLGMRHALEPDHLAAVSTLVSAPGRRPRGILLGAFWGVGHSFALLLVGCVLAALHARLPTSVAGGFEILVALMLVTLGTRAIIRARLFALTAPMTLHQHGGRAHAHAGDMKHVRVWSWALASQPLAVGLVHGLAGSGALTALVLADLPSMATRLAYLALFRHRVGHGHGVPDRDSRVAAGAPRPKRELLSWSVSCDGRFFGPSGHLVGVVHPPRPPRLLNPPPQAMARQRCCRCCDLAPDRYMRKLFTYQAELLWCTLSHMQCQLPQSRRRRFRRFASTPALAVCLCACGGSESSGTSAAPSFSGAPFQSVASVSGQMQIEVRWSPQDPVVGVDSGEFTVRDATGAPADGLTLTIVPWMPAHGHGTAVKPVITETSPGVFVATPLYLYMSGHWDLRTTIAGADSDTATPSVDLP